MRTVSTADKRRWHYHKQRVVTLLVLIGAAMSAGIASRALGTSAADTKKADPQDTTLPHGYRDWRVISVAHEAGKLNDIRAILGNDAAFNASRDGRVPFPDGARIARLAWAYTPSEANNKVFGSDQSFVAGPATNVQVLVKDSQKFAATGGWGFAQFDTANSSNAAIAKECFACHLAAKKSDFVFTHYAP